MTTLDSLTPLPPGKITPEIHARVEIVLASITPHFNAGDHHASIPRGTLGRYKAEIRKIFGLPPRSSFEPIIAHPKLRIAVEYIVVRAERSDKNSLRCDLDIVMPTGETLDIEAFLKSLYPREGVNASSCHRTLKARCMDRKVLDQDGNPVTLSELPSEAAVIRFLRNFRRENISVRRARSRKHDFDKFNMPFVSRNNEDYRPGQLWFCDHTEDDFIVLNERGKPDRRWITAWMDMRTRLLIGYHLSWQPNSQTIALSFRNAVTGEQLRAYDGEKYVPVNINTVPEEIEVDNGKDYRSKYTQRVFGKIDFDDKARLSVQRITKLHYSLPYHGQSKAPLERWFGTVHNIMRNLPGYKGNNARVNQPDALKDEVKQGELMAVETYDKLFALAVDVYNNRVHRTLRNQTPLVCYLSSQNHQRSIDIRVLDFLMMKVKDKKIHRCEIDLFTNRYYSEVLVEYDFKMSGKRAEVYYDPMDLGFVAVYVDEKFITVAVNKEMIGKGERGWLRILNDRKHLDHKMAEDIKVYHRGMSRVDAKLLLLEGELRGASPVPAGLLNSSVPAVRLLTGLEGQAIEQQKELEDQKALVEFEKAAKKKSTRLTIAAVNKIW